VGRAALRACFRLLEHSGVCIWAAAQRNISWKRNGPRGVVCHHGKPLNDWAGTLKFKLDSGADLLVFCIQIDVRVRSGARYRGDGPVLALPNGCKIRYLLDKYPASSAYFADEAAARQLAIWVFSDDVDPTTERGDRAIWPILMGVVLLLISGWLLRRRAMR
jgi:LPXTG-motif cell wall-anchored protein